MLWEVLRKIFGLELRPDPSEAWLIAGKAPGTCSREPPPLEPRDDIEPAKDNACLTHLDHPKKRYFKSLGCLLSTQPEAKVLFLTQFFLSVF